MPRAFTPRLMSSASLAESISPMREPQDGGDDRALARPSGCALLREQIFGQGPPSIRSHRHVSARHCPPRDDAIATIILS